MFDGFITACFALRGSSNHPADRNCLVDILKCAGSSQLVRQWVITQTVTEQTRSLTILRLQLFVQLYFYMVVSNYLGVPPNHRNHFCFRILLKPSSTMVAGSSTPNTDQLPRDIRWINFGDSLRHFFPCET